MKATELFSLMTPEQLAHLFHELRVEMVETEDPKYLDGMEAIAQHAIKTYGDMGWSIALYVEARKMAAIG